MDRLVIGHGRRFFSWPLAAPSLASKLGYPLRSQDWHYIRYADGSEELYDCENDPHEWDNLAARSEHEAVLADFRRRLPQEEAEELIGEWQESEIKAWRNAEQLRGK